MNYQTDYEFAFVQKQLSTVWPNWHISRKLGKGSYGSVYEIVRDDLGTRYTCALKVLHMETQGRDTTVTGGQTYSGSTGSGGYSQGSLGSGKNGSGQGSLGSSRGQGSLDSSYGQGSRGQGSLGSSHGQGSLGSSYGQGSRGQGSLESSHGQGSLGSSQGQGSLAQTSNQSEAQMRIAQRTVWNSSSAGAQAPPPDLLLDGISGSEIEDFVRSVSTEIDLMMQLKGVPNIVTIEDYAILRDPQKCTILIRMEELETLDEYLRRKGSSLQKEDLIRLGTDICSALNSCEQRYILHRDIKPNNLFYSEEAGFKLGDFGISRSMAAIREKASMSGIGTLRYMAPEVYNGRSYNNTADIYSLGIVLYILANGLLPPLYETGTDKTPSSLSSAKVHDANMRRLRGEALPPPRYADEMLSSVILTACNPLPERRFQSAEAFRKALLTCLNTSSGPIESSDTEPSSKSRLLPLICILAASVGILVFLLVKIFTGNTDDSSSSSDSVASSDQPVVESQADDESDPDAGTDTAGTAPADDSDETDPTPADNTDESDSDSGEDTAQPDSSSADESGSDSENDQNTLLAWTDENLKESVLPQVQSQLGISGDITIGDAMRVQTLDLADSGISDISSLKYFVGLTQLDLCNNFVTDISPLADLKKLQDLNLEKNMISSVAPIADLVRLKELDLYQNNISDISALSGLTQLTMLDIRENNISDISALSNMGQMEELYLSSNSSLRDISSLSNMPALWYVSFKETSVSDITPLKNDTAITTLVLGWTNTSDISTVDSLPKIGYLDIRGCPINDYGPADRAKQRNGAKVER